jgi:hypothetical protein
MKNFIGHFRARRFVVLFVGGLSSLLLAGTTIYALGGFTATIANTGPGFASGTILLQENQGVNTCLSSAAGAITTNSGTCATINLFGTSNADPGTLNTTSVSFENIGTINASTFTLTPAGCTQAHNAATSPYYGSDASFCSLVDITIENDTVPGSPVCVFPAGNGACPSPSNSNTLSSLGVTPISLGSLASGATDTFTINAELDPSATNADQGLAANDNITWELAQ